MDQENKPAGISLFGLVMISMFLIMFTLKLIGTITVSWWVVTAPLWGWFLLMWLILFIIELTKPS